MRSKQSANKPDTYSILNRGSLIVPGSVLELDIETFPAIHRPAIRDWLAEMPASVLFAGWVEEKYVLDRRQLRWAYDGSKYTAAALVAHILVRAIGPGMEINISGWHFWKTSDGTTLHDLAHPRLTT